MALSIYDCILSYTTYDISIQSFHFYYLTSPRILVSFLVSSKYAISWYNLFRSCLFGHYNFVQRKLIDGSIITGLVLFNVWSIHVGIMKFINIWIVVDWCGSCCSCRSNHFHIHLVVSDDWDVGVMSWFVHALEPTRHQWHGHPTGLTTPYTYNTSGVTRWYVLIGWLDCINCYFFYDVE